MEAGLTRSPLQWRGFRSLAVSVQRNTVYGLLPFPSDTRYCESALVGVNIYYVREALYDNFTFTDNILNIQLTQHSHTMADAIPQQAAYTFQDGVSAVKNGSSLSDTTQRLLKSLTRSERLLLLDGDERFWTGLTSMLAGRYNSVPYSMGTIDRLGVPGVRFSDGPCGIVVGNSTAFPVSMARGATWDVDLERRIGRAIGKEGRAQGANFYAGVCVNLPRHPAWGRIQETYSDDPLLLGEFGLALAQGVQEQIMACVKHFALNSMENARFQVDIQVADDVLHEVYLPHFRRIVEGGVASVMSAYNAINGEWCGQNRKLLIEILRDDWRFDGFTMSDFVFGFRDAPLSVKNGLDVEAPFSQQRAMHLEKALQSGELD